MIYLQNPGAFISIQHEIKYGIGLKKKNIKYNLYNVQTWNNSFFFK